MRRFTLIVCSALLVGCATGGAVKLESSADNAPKWRLSPPGGDAKTIYSVGMAEGASERFAVEHAKADAGRQLVIKHYGVQIASILQTGQTQKTQGTLEDGKFEGATATTEHVIDTITQSAAGTVKGLEVKEIYTERWRDNGQDVHKAWVLSKVNRALMDKTVRETIEKSPTMVEARQIEASATQHVQDIRRLAGEVEGAGQEARYMEMQGHVITVSAKFAALESQRSRYQALLGRPKLPVDTASASAAHERAKQSWSTAVRAMRVAVHVKTADGSRRAGMTSAVMTHLNASKIPATEGGAQCPAETAFWLRIEVSAAACRRPGMGVSCELPVVAHIGRCSQDSPLDTSRLQMDTTRGAAMDEGKAKAKAWARVSAGQHAELRALLEGLVGRHLPLSLLGEK